MAVHIASSLPQAKVAPSMLLYTPRDPTTTKIKPPTVRAALLLNKHNSHSTAIMMSSLSEHDNDDGGLPLFLVDTDSDASSQSTAAPKMSAARVGFVTQVDALSPHNLAQAPRCNVVVNFDTTNLPNANKEAFTRSIYMTPLENSLMDLSTCVLRHACADFRAAQSEMMLALKAEGKGLHMRSFTSFNDERDAYFRRDAYQVSRVAKLSDLFFNRRSLKSNPEVPIIVKIDIVDLGPDEKAVDTADFHPYHKHFAFHRIATAADQQASPPSKYKKRLGAFIGPMEEVQHKPVQVAHLIRYPRVLPCGPVVGVPFREVNGELIGNTRVSDEIPSREGEIWGDRYRVIENPVQREEVCRGNLIKEADRFDVQTGVPVLPSLTFLPYVGKGADLGGEKIHIAVSLYNALEGSTVEVPIDIVMKVGDGSGMKEVICDALSRKLKEFYGGLSSNTSTVLSNGLKMMSEEGQWHWDLWVLPQKVEGKEKVMYRFREGSLKVFLDEDMVKSGKSALYMEAHIVQ